MDATARSVQGGMKMIVKAIWIIVLLSILILFLFLEIKQIERSREFFKEKTYKLIEENTMYEYKIHELESELEFYRNQPVKIERKIINFTTIQCEKSIHISELKPYIVKFTQEEMLKELFEQTKQYVEFKSSEDEFGYLSLRLRLRVEAKGDVYEID